MKANSMMDSTKITKYFKNQKPPIISQLKSNFKDPYFPPNLNSIQSKDSKGEFIDKDEGPSLLEELGVSKTEKLTWKRASEINKDMVIFNDKIRIKEIRQGDLGDCYFLSSLAALSTLPYLIREKFRLTLPNKYGYIEVILFIDGEWQIIFIDDYFPYDRNEFIFAKPFENIYWSVILEKVWAKVNGGYSNIIGGVCEEPIEALTGFPSETIEHSEIEKLDLFNQIEEGNLSMLMTASSNENVDKEETGIEPGHAYTIIQAKKWEKKNIYLIRLRNPWGEGEWKGKYSDKSSVWKKELIDYFGYCNKNDGVFWISIEDYMTYFRSTHICYLFFDSIIKVFHFDYLTYFKVPTVFNLFLKESGKTCIRIIFKNWRFNRNIKNSKRPFVLFVGKYDENRNICKIYSKYGIIGDINFIEELDKGYYVIWLYCSYNDIKNDPNFKYTMQITSEKKTNFICEFIGQDSTFLFIQHLILNNYQIEKKDLLASSEYHIGSLSSLKGIYGAIMFNKSSNKWLNIKVKPKLTNVKLFPPYSDKSQIEILIPPNQKTCVLGMNISTSCSYSLSTSSSFKTGITNPIPKEPEFNNFLRFNLSNELSDLMGRANEYHYVSKDLINQIPKFETNEYIKISDEYLRKSSLRTFIINNNNNNINNNNNNNNNINNNNNNNNFNHQNEIMLLLKKYQKEFELIKKNFPVLERDKNVKIVFDKVDCNTGTYIGELNEENRKFRGRGLFIYNNGFKYLGYFYECLKDYKGLILDKDNKKRFYGDFKNDNREGQGELIMENDEKYIGEFKNNQKEGKGIYYFKNGSSWEGNFKNNMKHGIGKFTQKDGKIWMLEYENDHLIGKYDLNNDTNNNKNNSSQNNINNISQNTQDNKNNNNINQNNINQNNINNINQNNINQNNINNINQNNINQNNINPPSTYDISNFKKPEIINNITVSCLNFFKMEESEEKNILYLKRIKELNEKNPFMLQKVLNLNSSKEEYLHFISQNDMMYLGNMNKENKKEGRGALFKGIRYYIGYFSNDLPIGIFDIYSIDKKKLFRGEIDSNYNLKRNVNHTKYYIDGCVYFGQLEYEIPNGYGNLFYINKSFWAGNFKNGKFDGKGKYFFKNGVLSQYITYKENEFISQEDIIIEDFNYEGYHEFFSAHQKIGKKLLSLKYSYYFETELKWVKIELVNKDEYLGQVDKFGIKNGKGCIIYNNNNMKNNEKYYIGFFRNNERNGDGILYDENWNIIYEGQFLNDKKNGFGILNFRGNIFSGYFLDDKLNGKGVYYYNDKTRFEGNFLNSMRHGKGYIINPIQKTIQEVKYNNNNIIKQNIPIFCSNESYLKNKRNIFQQIYSQYNKYVNELMNFTETSDNITLQFNYKKDDEGYLYIGEFNNIGFKHGRGYLLYPDTKRHYIGYFWNGLKHGQGALFSDENKKEYVGNFDYNFPNGEGTYYLENGCIIKGIFNKVGGGKGKIIFPNKESWDGLFYGLLMNSEGDYYNSIGNFVGKRKYKLSKLVN